MEDTIRSVFESECSHLKFDSHLAKKISNFATWFVNKNEEHSTFFGGHLTGTHVVRFTIADKDEFFNILEINELALEEKIIALPSINKDFNVSSDVFNHVCMWLIHKWMNTPLMSDSDKHEAMINSGLIMHYRFLTSLLAHSFKYPADPQICEATYACLSKKFLLKQYGSWSATLVARCEDLISKSSIHYHVLKDYKRDSEIVYLINDIQGRIRDMFKNIREVFYQTKDSGMRFVVTSDNLEHDGESILKDKTKNLQQYNRYLSTIITDKNSFIKEELIEVISNMMTTMPKKLLLETLSWCSANYRNSSDSDVEDLINLTLTHSFAYLNNNKTLLTHSNNLQGLISKLHGVYMSSRSTDPELLLLRTIAQRIVKNSTSTKNDATIASVRTGLLLYIVIRSFTMHHYASR